MRLFSKNFFNNLLNFYRKNNYINQDFFTLYGTARELIKRAERRIEQFENIFTITPPLIGLSDVHEVYIDSIIVLIAQLINATKSDKAGLKQFKNIAPKNIKNKLIALEQKYNDMIQKIAPSRSKLVAHTDINPNHGYIRMGFSKETIDEITNHLEIHQDRKSLYEKLITYNKNNQRYSLLDFRNDVPKFKSFLNDFCIVIDEINIYYVRKINEEKSRKSNDQNASI